MEYIIKYGLLVLAYLIGSIPFGFLFGKMKGIDLREHGSKNIGSTNAGRVLGKKYAIYTYIGDMFKGAIIVFLFRFEIIPQEYCLFSPLVYGLAAVLGHTFSIYLNFKGGKAVATGSGVILGYCPWLFGIALLVFLITTKISKYVSLGSLVGVTFTFLLTIVLYFIGTDPIFGFEFEWFLPVATLIIAIIIFIRHLTNIERIINRSESKVNWK